MSSSEVQHWREANQRYLTAALGLVREALERHAAPDGPSPLPGTSRKLLEEARSQMPAAPALDVLCAQFGLSPFERDVLLLCAGTELDSRFATLCTAAQGDPARACPTFSLALAALPEAHWSALTPAAPLRRWRLIELSHADKLTLSPLRIDERILHCLAGLSHPDERLRALVEPLCAPRELPASLAAVAARIVRIWSGDGDRGHWPAILLCGSERAGKHAAAAAACAELGIPLYAVRAADIPAPAAERETLLLLWEREAMLSGSVLLVDADDWDSADRGSSLAALIEALTGRLIVSSREPLPTRSRPPIRLDVDGPSAAEQRLLWRRALGEDSQPLDGELDAVVAQFHLSLEGIRAASAAVKANGGAPGFGLWDACRIQARPRLDDLAQRIDPVATWEDLVLPQLQFETLREIAAHVRHRVKVYEDWGFASKGRRGLGISALFAGSSGTGKTMAAEVLANELRLDLYRIDLSQVVSKYIGETEKNLRRVFDAAEEGGALLLFDEADALFGKRSEVRDSHDRYANIEVSYLLQRMESYRGAAILTTNMKSALDAAFLRRIRFVVHFPFPDAAQRAEIWRRIFPVETPTRGLDIDKLARLNVSGGSIRNIALNAAFLAAEAGEPVRMSHLLQAARSEYVKLEKPLTEAEIGGWS